MNVSQNTVNRIIEISENLKQQNITNNISLNSYIEHTLLKPGATEKDFINLCKEAFNNSYYGVCVPSSRIKFVKNVLKGSNVKIISTVSFPFGNEPTSIKAAEAAYARDEGADEIDMVLNIGKFKDENYKYIYNDVSAVSSSIGPILSLKVILETSQFTKEDIIKAGYISLKAGADFLKTSTGFLGRGVTIEDIKILKSIIEYFKEISGEDRHIKASGGIRSRDFAIALIRAGAVRLGSSSSMTLMKFE